ncbi:MAG: hypothetical protein AVDCRST_MAG06-386, partial [uncultured Nocardioides sp.]
VIDVWTRTPSRRPRQSLRGRPLPAAGHGRHRRRAPHLRALRADGRATGRV